MFLRPHIISKARQVSTATFRCLPKVSTRASSSQAKSEERFDEQAMRQELFLASMKRIEQEGWKDECLAKAATDVGLPAITHRVFRRGVAEVFQLFLEEKRMTVRTGMQAGEEGDSSSAEFDAHRLEKALHLHLSALSPHKPHLADAIALSLDPREWPYTAHSVFATVDDLCHFASIRASRLDWYSERALMGFLYCTTEMFLLTDTSADFADTKEFIKRNVAFYQRIRQISSNGLGFLLKSIFLQK